VEIPEEIRRRAQNGVNGVEPQDEEGGSVLTPPGPGGDVHGGGPMSPPSDQRPPSPPSTP
jgi:cell division protease FtsH